MLDSHNILLYYLCSFSLIVASVLFFRIVFVVYLNTHTSVSAHYICFILVNELFNTTNYILNNINFYK